MDFKTWFINEEQHSNDAMFMQTDKSGNGPTNAKLKTAKPSNGWLPPGRQPALWMKKKMKKV